LSSVADFGWSLGLVVACMVQARGLMECPTGPPFLSFAKENKHPEALTETQSHVLVSDEINLKRPSLPICKCFIYQINFIFSICALVLMCLPFDCSDLMLLQFSLKWRCYAVVASVSI